MRNETAGDFSYRSAPNKFITALDIRDAIRNVDLKYEPNSVVIRNADSNDSLHHCNYFPNCQINQILKLLKTNRLNFCNY